MTFNSDTIAIIRMLLELVVKYGQPAVERLMEIWAVEGVEITPELIQKHMDELPPPESFFNRKGD